MISHRNNALKTRTGRGLLAIACFSALAGSALAAPPAGEPLRQTVQFADLDVTRPAGVSLLYRRIEKAAQAVCEPFSRRDPALAVRWHVCLDEAIARAVGDVHIPTLTSYYLVKSGQRDPSVRLATQH